MIAKKNIEKIYENLYNERKPETEDIFTQFKDRNCKILIEDLIFQFEKYQGQHIHKVTGEKLCLIKYLDEFKAILDDKDMTLSELKKTSPYLFNKLVANELYCILYDDENRLSFLKF